MILAAPNGAGMLRGASAQKARLAARKLLKFRPPRQPRNRLNAEANQRPIDQAHSHSSGGEFQLAKEFLDRHRVTVGTEFRHDFSLSQKSYDEAPAETYLD